MSAIHGIVCDMCDRPLRRADGLVALFVSAASARAAAKDAGWGRLPRRPNIAGGDAATDTCKVCRDGA